MPRPAFTLVEVAVTLVVLVLAAALVAPALNRPGPEGAPDLSSVVARARELAVRRAQPLVLHVEASGRWSLRSDADTTSIGSGQLRQAPAWAVALRLSPTGICVPISGLLQEAWDALRCRPVSGVVRTPRAGRGLVSSGSYRTSELAVQFGPEVGA